MADIAKNIRTRAVFKIGAHDDQEKFKPLPPPVGQYPFQLDLERIKSSKNENKMVFQTCGDTGGIVLPTFQHQVVNEMIRQFDASLNDDDKPSFFFHLGDLVYNFGQQDQYYPQFFAPFKNYPAPVFAIAGNHDADIDPSDPRKPESLDAFLKVFCNTEFRPINFSEDIQYKSGIQPNIYFTLQSPLATIIALYSNVPRFGTITNEQREWFIAELKKAGKQKNEKAIIICLHHSAYSADTNHGSSLNMQQFLNSAFDEAGVWPHLVMSGHVHNYQRFTKTYPNGKVVPFIVAGAGGYAQLHTIAPLNDPDFPDTSHLLDDVYLEKYCDDAHGFLRITITRYADDFTLEGGYYTIDDLHPDQHAVLFDAFSINLSFVG
jgi:predicted phosphodiesterase